MTGFYIAIGCFLVTLFYAIYALPDVAKALQQSLRTESILDAIQSLIKKLQLKNIKDVPSGLRRLWIFSRVFLVAWGMIILIVFIQLIMLIF